jgi:cytochrome b involved in lipid metabolism
MSTQQSFDKLNTSMGWIAYSGSAIVAAFAIHSFLSRTQRSQPQPVTPVEVKEGPESEDIVEELEADKDEVGPSIVVAVEEESDEFPANLEHVNTAPEPPPKTTTLMPPPPLPRRKSSSPPRLKPPSFSSGLAPPRPANGALRPPPSAAASLRVPQTKVLSNTSMAPSLGVSRNHVSKQAMLEPGYSPLDWAALTSKPNNQLRGKDAPANLIKVTPSQLKIQNGRKGRDAWTSFQGKVYNITPYIPFHPGGKGEIMRGAGKDCTTLFMETHPWVNIDMLRECLVGIMVPEDEAANANANNPLDEMD